MVGNGWNSHNGWNSQNDGQWGNGSSEKGKGKGAQGKEGSSTQGGASSAAADGANTAQQLSNMSAGAREQYEALVQTQQAIKANAVSTSKKKKAEEKAAAAKARKLANPLTGEALLRVQKKNEEVDRYHALKTHMMWIGPIRVRRTPISVLKRNFGKAGTYDVRRFAICIRVSLLLECAKSCEFRGSQNIQFH